jgi:lipid A disaccharide synthetase
VLRRNLPMWLERLRAAGHAPDGIDVLVPEFLADEARASYGSSATVLTDKDAAFARARAAIAFPGTITLELLLHRIPTRVWAVLDAPTLWAGRARLRGPRVALANVLTGSEAFPEWIGTARRFRAHPPALASPIEAWPAIESPVIAAAWERMGSDLGVAMGVAACLGE